jgi:hypothetical protein
MNARSWLLWLSLAVHAALGILAGSAAAEDLYADWPRPDVRRKVGGHEGYNSGRGTYLPSGSGKLYLTLTVGDNWSLDPRQAAVVNWFGANARLLNLQQQTHYNFYTLSNPHFRDQLARYYGTAVPIVTLQRPDGKILLNVTAKSMPPSGGELADLADDALELSYAAPTFDGQSQETPIESEAAGPCPDDRPCPPDGPCPLGPDGPPLQPLIPEVSPASRTQQALAAAVFALAAIALGAVAWFSLRPTGDKSGGGQLF